MVASRRVVALSAAVLCASCNHEPLDFGLGKDAGAGGELGTGASNASGTGASNASGTGANTGNLQGSGGANSFDGVTEDFMFGSLDLTAGDMDGDGDIGLDDLTDLDWLDWADWAIDDAATAGFPTSDDQWASWCVDGGDPQTELCGTDLDEDCDGFVDEALGLGDSCFSDCGSYGTQVCDPFSNGLTCLDDRKERCIVPLGCGNEASEADEQCDISAGSSAWYNTYPLGLYCTSDCRLDTYFTICVGNSQDGPVNVSRYTDSEGVVHDTCADAGLVCSLTTKTCVYKVAGDWDSCPDLQRLESHEAYARRLSSGDSEVPVYRQVESDKGECWITCQDDADCPGTIPTCYMGTCVSW